MKHNDATTGHAFMDKKKYADSDRPRFIVPCKMPYPGGGFIYVNEVTPLINLPEVACGTAAWKINGYETICPCWIINKTTLYWEHDGHFRHVSASGAVSPMKNTMSSNGLILAPLRITTMDIRSGNPDEPESQKDTEREFFFDLKTQKVYKRISRKFVEVTL